VAAHEQDRDPEHRAEHEREPPPEVGREDRRVEQDQRADRAARRAEPVRAVDDEVDAPPHARRDELVDRGVDRRVLAADARAGEESGDEEVQRRVGERGGHGRHEIEQQRDEEEPLAAVAIGQLPEEERTDARAGHVDRARGQHLARGERDPAVLLGQPRGDRADDCHLEPVEDPDRPEADDYEPVEAHPGEAVKPRRDAGLDGLELSGRHGTGALPTRA
jgi:hypothetical protein